MIMIRQFGMILFGLLPIQSLLAGPRCNMVITIENKTTITLNLFSWKSDHGQETPGFITHVFKPGAVSQCRFESKNLTGVEGTLSYLAGGTEPAISIYYDNPLIGSAAFALHTSEKFMATLVSWVRMNASDDYALHIRINEAGAGVKPVDLVYDKRGVIKGTLFWKKSDIQGPETYPVYKAFQLNAFAPEKFTTANDVPGIKGMYNGSNGTFTGFAKVGKILYTVDDQDPLYFRIHYTASGLPVNIPVQFDITTGTDITRWIPGSTKLSRPDSSSVFVVGTFPVQAAPVITMQDHLLEASGLDFSCEGDWMQVDVSNALTGNGSMLAKIAGRKTAPVLPYESWAAGFKNQTRAGQLISAPAMQQKTQQTQVHKVKTGTVRIRQ